MRRTLFAGLAAAGIVAALHIAPVAAAPGLDPVAYYKLRVEAQRLVAQNDFAHAAEAYERLTNSYSGDSATWMNWAGCLGRLEKWEPAAAAYRHVYALGGWTRSEIAHEIAGCWSRAGKPDSALVWLERSLALGYEDRPELGEQEDFVALRGNDRFQRAAGAPAKETLTRDAGWRSDLDYFVAEVQRLHFVYRAAPLPPGFQAGVRDLRDRIPSLSDAAVMVGIQGLLAQLGDGHSTLYPVPGGRVALRQVPLQFCGFADGVLVVNAPDELKDWIGVRIERVGRLPVNEVLQRIEPYVSRDNANGPRMMGPYFMRFSTLLQALGVIDDEKTIPLVGTAPSGRKIEGAIPAAPLVPGANPHSHPAKLGPPRFAGAPAAPRYLQRVQEHYWYEASPADSVMYVQFNQVIDMPDLPLRQFALNLRKELETAPVRTVIVDVRHNNGGNGELLVPLLRTLIRFETSGPGRRLFVITGPATFSAAQSFVAQLDRLTNAVFVGEPSGSRPNFVGEDASLLLPWSGLRGSVSTRTHRVSSADERVWIAPEMPVPATGADWLAGRDPALDAVLQLVRGN